MRGGGKENLVDLNSSRKAGSQLGGRSITKINNIYLGKKNLESAYISRGTTLGNSKGTHGERRLPHPSGPAMKASLSLIELSRAAITAAVSQRAFYSAWRLPAFG